MVRQLVHAVALGYEDLNDHDALRDDPLVQTACDRDESLASSSTLCRFEQRAQHQWAIAIHQELVERFIASVLHPPEELVLDFDATDGPVHCHQPGRFFPGYYDSYCYLPLYVFCGQQLLVAYLRPSNIDGSRHAWAILSLLVKRLRQAWPGVGIVFRADSGFCRHRMFDWCGRNDVRYIVGLARNRVLEREFEVACEVARDGFEATGMKTRVFSEFEYAADTWRRSQTGHRANRARTQGAKSALHRDQSTRRSKVAIREAVLSAWGHGKQDQGTATCPVRRPDLALEVVDEPVPGAALGAGLHTLLETMRRAALEGTKLARAQCHTLRLRLLRIGAVVTRNTRTIAVRLSSACPDQGVFRLLVQRLTAG